VGFGVGVAVRVEIEVGVGVSEAVVSVASVTVIGELLMLFKFCHLPTRARKVHCLPSPYCLHLKFD
jgi:hypothetical protein